jgi:hypothetical protein
MKWIGQHIWDLISRFRSDVYLEGISTGTIASGGNLGLDSNNKIVKATDSAPDADASTKGIVELATTAETTTGTDTTRAVTPDGLKDGYQGSTNVVTVGTIATGEWRATTINAAYLSGQSGTNTGDETLASINALDITEVGTIDSGVWQGTAITHAYIGNDAIEGDNIADDAVDSEHYTDASIDTVHIGDDQVTFAKASGVTSNVYGNIIKLLPSDFAANDDGGNNKLGIGYVDHAGTSYGMRPADAATELFAFISIPEGMKATHIDIYDKNDLAVEIFECQINATTMTSKGTGNCNIQIDITDVNSTATNFLAIQVTTTATSDRVFGGQVTIAAI